MAARVLTAGRDAPMKIVFMGAPGVGKGTFAGMLAPKLGIPMISTGDVIRHHIKSGTAAGKEMQVRCCGALDAAPRCVCCGGWLCCRRCACLCLCGALPMIVRHLRLATFAARAVVQRPRPARARQHRQRAGACVAPRGCAAVPCRRVTPDASLPPQVRLRLREPDATRGYLLVRAGHVEPHTAALVAVPHAPLHCARGRRCNARVRVCPDLSRKHV
jgi:hypothetical protein